MISFNILVKFVLALQTAVRPSSAAAILLLLALVIKCSICCMRKLVKYAFGTKRPPMVILFVTSCCSVVKKSIYRNLIASMK